MFFLKKYGNGLTPIENILKSLIPIAAYFALIIAISNIADTIYAMKFQNVMSLDDLAMPVSGLCDAICIPIFAWMCKRDKERRIFVKNLLISRASIEDAAAMRAQKEPDPSNVSPFSVVWAVLAAVSAAVMFNITINFLPLTSLVQSYDEGTGQVFSFPVLIQVAIAVIFVPAAEELVFRGCVQRRLGEWLKTGPAVIISALLFALYHWNLLQSIYAFFMGLILALICEKYATVKVCIIGHMCSNAVMLLCKDSGILKYLCITTPVAGIAVLAVSVVLTVISVIAVFRIDPYRIQAS